MLTKKHCCCGAVDADCCYCDPCSVPRKDLRWSFTAVDPSFPVDAIVPSHAPGGDFAFPTTDIGTCGHEYTRPDPASVPFDSLGVNLQCGEGGLTVGMGDAARSLWSVTLTAAHIGYSGTCYPLSLTWTLSAADDDPGSFPYGPYRMGYRTVTVYDPGPDYTDCPRCSPCPIPYADLTASFSGTGGSSGTATFHGINGWVTGCVGNLIFTLSCNTGSVKLCAKYFFSESCPTGDDFVACCSDDSPPGLVLADHTCDPFHLHFTVDPDGCPAFDSIGITDIYFDA